MRHRAFAAAAIALAALAACGKPEARFERPDGSFDRDAYRAFRYDGCLSGMAQAGTIPSGEIPRFCGCEVDNILATNSDEELRAMLRDYDLRRRKRTESMRLCQGRISGGTEAGGGESASGFTPRGQAPAGPGAGADNARARANLAAYVSNDDYPASALRNNEQGRVGFVLTVGPDGRVSDCAIRESSGSATLDSTTCRIMRSRARFDPARDADGQATSDSVPGSILWRIQEE